ncbi:MAG: NAD(P)/FAD-dependent oxidoreductase [Deltaproteobacteria bacterium]|nr:NAD(P)/FAD-dependent oxidoreductase [Deltaproteobacteria bacterium]
MKNYIIIGNGAAGATAARKIREADSEGSITIFSAEGDPFYYRPRLPDFIAGIVELPKITLQNSDWYASRQIDLHLGEMAAEIDSSAREVRSEKGEVFGYDALLLATGARSFIPPVPGTDKDGVYALRTFDDARSIAAQAEKVENAILIGGGLLGLEAGYGLTRRGLKVKVVEFFDRLLPRQMDLAGAFKLQKMLEEMGFSFYLGARAKEIIGGKAVERLALEDGRVLEGGLVLFSAGIRPNLDLAQQIGLEVDKGVKVDNRLMTSQEGVWAAGDLIEHNGRVYGIWPAALAQGEVAGTNMAGGEALYQGTLMSNSLKVVGVNLTSAGEIDPEGKLPSAVFEAEGGYRKIVLVEGRMAGYIFLGLTRGIKECQAALEQETDVSSFLEEMKEGEFDFSKLIQ